MVAFGLCRGHFVSQSYEQTFFEVITVYDIVQQSIINSIINNKPTLGLLQLTYINDQLATNDNEVCLMEKVTNENLS